MPETFQGGSETNSLTDLEKTDFKMRAEISGVLEKAGERKNRSGKSPHSMPPQYAWVGKSNSLQQRFLFKVLLAGCYA
jgi:hypothetical protein